MLTKIFYTGLLLVVFLASGFELWRVWTDPRLYIGRFEMAADGVDNDAKSKLFSRKVSLAHAVISRELKDYNDRGVEGTSDTTFGIGGHDQLFNFEDNLTDLALTYQDIDIGKLLASVRKNLSQPNEISGVVTELDNQFRVSVSWPQIPAVDKQRMTSFLTDPRATDAAAARQVACSIIWAQIARASPPEAKMGRSNFCQWVEILHDYAGLVTKQAEKGIEATDLQTITTRRKQLEGLATTGFPGVYRLRADLTDLLPPAERQKLLVEAQKDRLNYALLTDPSLKGLSEEDRRLAAFALARPALPIEKGAVVGAGDNWKLVLDPYSTQIAKSSAAVGIILDGDKYKPLATAFHVGRGFILTTSTVLKKGKAPTPKANGVTPPDPRIAGLNVCLAENAKDGCPPGMLLAVVEAYAGAPDSEIAILRIGDKSKSAMTLRDTATTLESLLDQYAYVIGYPMKESRDAVPAWFYKNLIGDNGSIKRLLPGRTVALEDIPLKSIRRLKTDINSVNGTGGGPLVDLGTGRVVAVQLDGTWDDKNGNFTLAEVISPEVVTALRDAMVKAEADEAEAEARAKAEAEAQARAEAEALAAPIR